jgi:hypothetical protein
MLSPNSDRWHRQKELSNYEFLLTFPGRYAMGCCPAMGRLSPLGYRLLFMQRSLLVAMGVFKFLRISDGLEPLPGFEDQ